MISKAFARGVIAMTVATAAHAQTDVLQLKRASELRSLPAETSASVASLPAQTALSRLPERQGAWMRVKTESGQTGWVHMFDVGSTAAPAPLPASNAQSSANPLSGALRGLTSLFNGGGTKPTTTTATSTVGIRGLGAEDIANAQPNAAALGTAESMRVDPAQAKRFATEAQIVARAVDPLPAPAPPPGRDGDAGGPGKMGGK
jgi:hypothetical protein